MFGVVEGTQGGQGVWVFLVKSCGRTEGWAGCGELGLWTPFQVFGGHWSTLSSTWKQGHSSFLGVKVWGVKGCSSKARQQPIKVPR